MIPTLAFPPTELQLKQRGAKYQVLCLIRKKWLVLTPEEWVRQHVVGYLVHVKKISAGRIALEKGFIYQERKKRWDIVTYDASGSPELLIECKGFEVALDGKVLQQISAYQHIVKAKKIILTNGIACLSYDFQQWQEGIALI